VPFYLTGSPEWRKDVPQCSAAGQLAIQRVKSVVRPDGQVSGDLTQHVKNSCATLQNDIRNQHLGGCRDTCGVQFCDALEQVRSKNSGRGFVNVALPMIGAPPSCR